MIDRTLKKIAKAKRRPTKVKTRRVGLDTFGNAIPDAAQVEGTGKSLRVVEARDIEIRPGKKRRRRKPVTVTPTATQAGVLSRWAERFRRTRAEDEIRAQQEAHDEIVSDLSGRFEHAFEELRKEFKEREQQLEEKLKVVSQTLPSPSTNAASKTNVSSKAGSKLQQHLKVAFGGLVAVLVGGYLLYVLTSMEGSMTEMSSNMTAMNGSIGAMGQDTRIMSDGIQKLDGNMRYMNGNIAQMNGNMAHMNQNVGQMTRAVEPMGQAAQNVNPFLGAMRSFLPF